MTTKLKTALLNERGYTLDGKCRLVPVDPTNEMSLAGNEALKQGGFFTSKADYFRAMIAASPAPELGEAVAVGYFQKHPVTGIWEETVGDGVLLYAAPPAPAAPADVQAALSADFVVCGNEFYGVDVLPWSEGGHCD